MEREVIILNLSIRSAKLSSLMSGDGERIRFDETCLNEGRVINSPIKVH
jgi:hypothetical protein